MSEKTASMTHYQKMTEAPIPSLTVKLSIPAIIGSLITTVYNMVDTFYVGKLGTSQAAAIGVAFSIMTFANAIGFLMGMGSGTVISQLLGAKKEEEASIFASTAFFATLIFSTILAILGIIFIKPFMIALGATETNLPYAIEYGRCLLIGFPIMTSSLVLSTIIRCEGKTLYSMIGIGIGGLLSIALAPVFIFVFNLGVRGAAITDVVCQTIGLLVLISFYLQGKSSVTLSVRNFSRKPAVYAKFLRMGTPSLCRHAISSLANIAMNFSAAPFGDDAQAAMSIIMRLLSLSQSLCNGMNQGSQTLFGFNYGAKKYRRVKEVFRFTLTLNTIMLFVIGVSEAIFAPAIVTLFRNDPNVIAIGAPGIRIQALAMVLIPINTLPNMLFQSVGEAGKSSFLASARQGFFYIPLVLILPHFFQITGLQVSMLAADVLTLFLAVPMLIAFFKRLNKKIAEEELA